jgi:hypothetical protein
MKVTDSYGVFTIEDPNMARCMNLILAGQSRICAVALYAKGGYRTRAVILDARELDVAGLPKIRFYETKFHETWAAAHEEFNRILKLIDQIRARRTSNQEQAA